VYYGADANNRYCLGALLFDLQAPARLQAVSGGLVLRVPLKIEHSKYLAAFFGYPELGACRSQ
jgi:predicted GH43/DUF377 family glycosyl hydrolase